MDIALFGSTKNIPVQAPRDGDQLFAVFGSVEIDLSRLDLPESLRLAGIATFGSIKLIVPRGTDVVIRGFALFGSQEYKSRAERMPEESPSVIYLNAVAVFGSVEVIED